MLRHTASCMLLAVLFLASSLATNAQERDRSKIPDKYKWNLADIYPTDDAWKAAKQQLVKRIPGVDQFKGKIGRSPKDLLACLDFSFNFSKELARLAVYAGLISDQDTRDASHLAMTQEIRQVGTDYGARSAYIEPEILKMSKKSIDAFLKKEPKLDIYRQYLDDLVRRKAHTGSEQEEKIIADAGLMSDAASSINNIFSNADFPYPQVTLSDGKTVKLDKAAFGLYRAVPNREDRKKVFEAFFGSLNDYRGTFGAQIYAQVKKDMFYAKARRYSSSLESALDGS